MSTQEIGHIVCIQAYCNPNNLVATLLVRELSFSCIRITPLAVYEFMAEDRIVIQQPYSSGEIALSSFPNIQPAIQTVRPFPCKQ
jgi:hypothetical protein